VTPVRGDRSDGARDETGAEALARLYDLDVAEEDGDLALYLALADRTRGPILELMAGSGRVAVPLAATGRRVIAVDVDPAMLARARGAAAAAGARAQRRLELVDADVDGYRHADAGRFGLAIVALGSMLLLPGRAAQRRAFATLAAHLAPGGVAVVDVPLLDADDLSRYDGRVTLDWVRHAPDGAVVTKTSSARHDATTRTVVLVSVFEEGLSGRPVARTVRVDRLHLLDAVDLEEMAAEADLAVEVLAGDADLLPLGPGADRAILVAVRGDAGARPRARRARGASDPAGRGGTSGGRGGTSGGRGRGSGAW
jgi:SAM-dependent methyltransferase